MQNRRHIGDRPRGQRTILIVGGHEEGVERVQVRSCELLQAPAADSSAGYVDANVCCPGRCQLHEVSLLERIHESVDPWLVYECTRAPGPGDPHS